MCGTGAVIEVDFYNAATLIALDDEEIVRRAHALLKAAVPARPRTWCTATPRTFH